VTRAVERAAQILLSLASGSPRLGVSEISELVDIPKLLSAPAQRLTGRTVTDPEALRQAVEAVRERGYAVEDQEATLGDAGLAAPVFDWTGRVVGALGIVGPVERLLVPPGRRGRLVDAVRSTAKALSRELGAGR
jgi:DNA-binding IclR family transcriptional regulator